MHWFFIALGIVVGLVATVAAIGALLPRDHVAAVDARIAARPDDVWRALTDRDAFPQWRPKLDRVEPLPDVNGHTSWREVSGRESIDYVADVADAPSRLVTRIASDGLPYGGAWEYRLAPDGDGTRVRIVERGAVYNPIFRFVSRFVMGHSATMRAQLVALGARFGQAVTPEEVSTDGL